MKTNNLSPKLFMVFVASLFTFLSPTLLSQETGTCAEKLKNAQTSFDKGQVELVPSLLKDCMKSGFNKEEALTAFKLLIQTFLLDDETGKADSSMFEFLKRYPEYRTSPTDHSSFVFLFNKYKVKPVVQLAVHAGINKPFLTGVSENLTGGEPGESVFSSKFSNLYLSVESKFKLNKNLEAGFEIGYSQIKVSNRIDFMGFAVSDYTETQNRIEIPVGITYDFARFGKFSAYGRGGLGIAYNLGTSATASSTPTDRNNPGNRTGETLRRKDSRATLDLFGQIGTGLKYKIPRGFFFAEVRSAFGFAQQNVSGGETVPLLEIYYMWRDPNFMLNALNINVGFTYIFYKPSKIKE